MRPGYFAVRWIDFAGWCACAVESLHRVLPCFGAFLAHFPPYPRFFPTRPFFTCLDWIGLVRIGLDTMTNMLRPRWNANDEQVGAPPGEARRPARWTCHCRQDWPGREVRGGQGGEARSPFGGATAGTAVTLRYEKPAHRAHRLPASIALVSSSTISFGLSLARHIWRRVRALTSKNPTCFWRCGS